MQIVGVVLAAGAGTRMGGPKALRRTPSGTGWAAHACEVLRSGGCGEVGITLAPGIRPGDLPEGVAELPVVDHETGLSASVVAAIDWAAARSADVLVLVPVDVPTLAAADTAAVLAVAGPAGLVRAVSPAGVPGHPVVIGVDHFVGARASLTGDRGLQAYLRTRPVRTVVRTHAADDEDHPPPVPRISPA